MTKSIPASSGALALIACFSACPANAQIGFAGAVSASNSVLSFPVWDPGDWLAVGVGANGSLTINSGGVVTSSSSLSVFIGVGAEGNGVIDVTGGTLIAGPSIFVGDQADGTLIVRNGGTVAVRWEESYAVPFANIDTFSSFLYVGAETGATASVQVSGGTLNTGQSLRLNGTGENTLTISGSGSVTSWIADIDRGQAYVSGGSWNIGGELFVRSGFGAFLDISGSGSVVASTVYADGETVVRGSGSLSATQLSINGSVEVNGGSVSVGNRLLISDQWSGGTLTINGGQVTAPTVALGLREYSHSTLNLSGGVLTTGAVGGPMRFPFDRGQTAAVRFDGGTLRQSRNVSELFVAFRPGEVTLEAGGGTIDTQGFTVATSYGLTGSGRLTKKGTGTLTLSGANTYAGGTTVSAGTLAISGSVYHPDASLSVAGSFVNQAVLNLGAGGRLTSSSAQIGLGSVNVSGGTWTNGGSIVVGYLNGGSLNISGGRVTTSDLSTGAIFAGLTSPASITLSGGILETGQVSKGTRNATFTFSGGLLRLTRDQSALFNGFPSGGVVLSAGGANIDTQAFHVASAVSLGGSGALTKTGTGVLTLSGANTYTGATKVQAGKLVVNGSLAGTAVTIADGAALGGSGSIGGATTLLSGATLAPGNSPGTLTFTNGLALEAGSILDFELGSISDLIVVSGGTLTGPSEGVITLNLFDSGGFTAGTYTLFDFGSGVSLSDFDLADFIFGTTLAGFDYSLDFAGTTLRLTAQPSAVPEPSTFAAIAGLAAFGTASLRRRRHAGSRL